MSKQPTFRVDKFAVPPGGRAEFLERIRATHDLLETQPGYVRHVILEQTAGPSDFNVVTIAEWGEGFDLEKVTAEVNALHERIGFDRQETVARLGIRADLGLYQEAVD